MRSSSPPGSFCKLSSSPITEIFEMTQMAPCYRIGPPPYAVHQYPVVLLVLAGLLLRNRFAE